MRQNAKRRTVSEQAYTAQSKIENTRRYDAEYRKVAEISRLATLWLKKFDPRQ